MTGKDTEDAYSDEVAKQIYQSLLDDIGDAINARDKDGYISHILLPHRMHTYQKTIDIEHPDEMGLYFERLVKHIDDLGVVELIRHCTLASFSDPDTISGCHESKLINKAVVIVEDYFGLSTLKKIDGKWKVAASQYAEVEPSIPTQVTQYMSPREDK